MTVELTLFPEDIQREPTKEEIDRAEKRRIRKLSARRKRVRKLRWKYYGNETRSEITIKADVRKRDGYRCQECGISDDEYYKREGRQLDVHRVFAGFNYRERMCVTLCRECHGKKKNVEEQDAFWPYKCYFNEKDLEFVERLLKAAHKRRKPAGQLMWEIVEAHLSRLEQQDAVPNEPTPVIIKVSADCRP